MAVGGVPIGVAGGRVSELTASVRNAGKLNLAAVWMTIGDEGRAYGGVTGSHSVMEEPSPWRAWSAEGGDKHERCVMRLGMAAGVGRVLGLLGGGGRKWVGCPLAEGLVRWRI